MATKQTGRKQQRPRELKAQIPNELLTALKAESEVYGQLKKLSKATRIEYNTLHLMVKNGTGTQRNINKAAKALNIAA